MGRETWFLLVPYRRCNTLRDTGRYVINIHKRRNGAVAGDEEARGRSKRQPSGSQELRVGKC